MFINYLLLNFISFTFIILMHIIFIPWRVSKFPVYSTRHDYYLYYVIFNLISCYYSQAAVIWMVCVCVCNTLIPGIFIVSYRVYGLKASARSARNFIDRYTNHTEPLEYCVVYYLSIYKSKHVVGQWVRCSYELTKLAFYTLISTTWTFDPST